MAEEEEVKLKPKQKPHYVDNKKFLIAMTEYRELRIKAEEEGKKRPTVTNYIGECYLKDCKSLYHIDLTLSTILIEMI